MLEPSQAGFFHFFGVALTATAHRFGDGIADERLGPFRQSLEDGFRRRPVEGSDGTRERHGDIPAHDLVAVARPFAQGLQRLFRVDAQEAVADRGLTEVAADIWLLVTQERLERRQQVRDWLRLASARRVLTRPHPRTPEIPGP